MTNIQKAAVNSTAAPIIQVPIINISSYLKESTKINNKWDSVEQIAKSSLEKILKNKKINVDLATQEDTITALAICEMSNNPHLITLFTHFKVMCTSAHIPIKNINNLIRLKVGELKELITKENQLKYQQRTQDLIENERINAPLPIEGISFPFGFIPDWEHSVMLDHNNQLTYSPWTGDSASTVCHTLYGLMIPPHSVDVTTFICIVTFSILLFLCLLLHWCHGHALAHNVGIATT